MATTLVRMDENVKVRFDDFVEKLNDFRESQNQSRLTNAQVLEMALESLIKKGNLLTTYTKVPK